MIYSDRNLAKMLFSLDSTISIYHLNSQKLSKVLRTTKENPGRITEIRVNTILHGTERVRYFGHRRIQKSNKQRKSMSRLC